MKKSAKNFLGVLFIAGIASCNGENAPINITNTPAINIALPPQSTQPQAPTPVATVTQKTNQKPKIQSLTPNPTGVYGPDDAITFKAIVYDQDDEVLSYLWSATKGTISPTNGEVATWRPRESDDQFVTGVVIVTLTVTDNRGGTDKSEVNLLSRLQGGAISPANHSTGGPSPTSPPQPTAIPEPTDMPISAPPISEPSL